MTMRTHPTEDWVIDLRAEVIGHLSGDDVDGEATADLTMVYFATALLDSIDGRRWRGTHLMDARNDAYRELRGLRAEMERGRA